MEKIFKAIGDFSRIRIINLLMQGTLCVTELSNIMQMSISAISRHLSRLNLVGIIQDKHEAQWVHYEMSEDFSEDNKQLLDYIETVAKRDNKLMDDVIRMRRYKQSEYCCKDLTTCKQQVEDVMEGNNG